MDDEKFNKMVKVTITSCILIVVLVVVICVYIFNSRKAELSIYADTGFTNKLESIGIKEEEFKQYLSVFSLLVNEDYSGAEYADSLDNIRALDTAVNFAKEIYSYEVTEDANGVQVYDAIMINDIIKEIKGMPVESSLNADLVYTYKPEENVYVKNNNEYKTASSIEIKDIDRENNKITVQYKCIFSNEEELPDDQLNSTIEEKAYTIKAIIVQNTDYKYSKYFVSSIEKI